MKKLFSLMVLSLFTAASVHAQEASKIMIAPGEPTAGMLPETHGMTYVVKEDGTANAWLRIDGYSYAPAGGTYVYTLPEGAKDDVKAWYRENGCRVYRGDFCTAYYGAESWTPVDVKRDGEKVTLTLPARKIDERETMNAVTIGIMYGLDSVTTKEWWGRDVEITTGTSDQFVTYLNVGVYLPDGVYVRDKEQGPKGWGEALSQTAMMDQAMVREQKATFAAGPHPAVFDTAGSGQVYRNRSNVMPGESYSFRLMVSTSIWKLYSAELLQGVAWVAGIAIVLSLLLYMIVGKKSLMWYAGVMVLLVVLFLLIGGMWMNYRFSFGSARGGGVYPMMLKGGMGGTTDVAPAVDPAMDVISTDVTLPPDESQE